MGLRRGGGRVLVLVLVALGWLLAPAAAGPPREVFTVTDVAVDAEAETAAAAREVALAEGQRRAFERLLERLTLRADYPRHPELDDARLSDLVQGIEVAGEKTSATRYLAELTVAFKPDGMRELLREAGLGFSETVSKPILVLPVYEVAGTQLLWDDPNPWRLAWLARERRDSLVPLLVPAGDLADIAAIGPAQALAGERERLAAIAGRYGVEDTMVARGRLSFDLAAGAPRLEVSLSRHGPGGDHLVIESFVGLSGEVIEDLLVRASRDITVELEETWKHDTLLQFDRETRLSATVPLGRLAAWLAVRQRLADVAMVRKVQVDSLSKASAQVVLHYLGTPEQLTISLAQRDLELVQEAGFWTLRLRDAAAPPAAPAPTATAAE